MSGLLIGLATVGLLGVVWLASRIYWGLRERAAERGRRRPGASGNGG